MEWFIAVVLVAVLGVAAMAAAGGMGEMATEPVRDTYRQDLPQDRPLKATDIQALRFGVTLRGYSMSQVDDVLDRLTREIAERDATIAELSASGGATTDGSALAQDSLTGPLSGQRDGRHELDRPRREHAAEPHPHVGPDAEERR